jgi:hypothetical protein
LFAGDEFVPREQSQGAALAAGGSATITRSVSTGGGASGPFQRIFTKGSTVYAPAIVEAFQLLDQDIDSVPPEQVSYCDTRA